MNFRYEIQLFYYRFRCASQNRPKSRKAKSWHRFASTLKHWCVLAAETSAARSKSVLVLFVHVTVLESNQDRKTNLFLIKTFMIGWINKYDKLDWKYRADARYSSLTISQKEYFCKVKCLIPRRSTHSEPHGSHEKYVKWSGTYPTLEFTHFHSF